MPENNDNRLPVKLPEPNMALASQLAAVLQSDHQAISDFAVNLAWLIKHPSSQPPHTQEQLSRRIDYFNSLPPEERKHKANYAQAMAYLACVHLTKYIKPVVSQAPPRIIVPRPPGAQA